MGTTLTISHLACPGVLPPTGVHPPAGDLLACHGLAPAGLGGIADHARRVRFPLVPPLVPHVQWGRVVNLPLHCPFPESKAMLMPLCFLDTAQGLLRAAGSKIWGRINEERRGQKTVLPSS